VALPNIDLDARRRRLSALINSVSLARTAPAVYIIEDAHWIDEVSESMFAGFLTVIPQTRSIVLITYRPEYRGSLAHMSGVQTISLAPLTEVETTQLFDDLLGVDPSVTEIGGADPRAARGESILRWGDGARACRTRSA
jgi:adenylate cyclase